MALRYLAEPNRYEETVNKSRFITRLFPLAQAADAKAVVEQVRKSDYGARHHATALVVGPDASQRRSSDDGEPAGTAGLPMLEALLRAQVTDILAVVTRYFGGVLLGKAGLARAYGGGVQAALAQASFLIKKPLVGSALAVRPADAGLANHLLRELAGRWADGIVQVKYGELADFEVWLPPGAVPSLGELLASWPVRAEARGLGQRLVARPAGPSGAPAAGERGGLAG
ncbi:MAG: YigZ family protein [Bifidobacteriaceae bacterium]|nr:YigZ family protein [Bifidobacteriaceae bacterium]